MIDIDKIRTAIVEAGKRLVRENLVQGTWGNISVRIDDTFMLITPSGMDYERMKESDLVKVNYRTMEYDGNVKPSSEKDVHAGIYLADGEANAVIHSHPSYCCALASVRKEVPAFNEEIKTAVGGSIKVAKYGLPSTKKLCKGVLNAMIGRNGCLMANHGVVVSGKDIDKAFEVIYVMEKGCRTYIEQAVEKASGKKYSDENMIGLFLNRKKA